MFAPFLSVIDSEPVPSEHPETSRTNSPFVHKYSSYDDLGHKFPAWGRPEKMQGYIDAGIYQHTLTNCVCYNTFFRSKKA